jgi:hypothetical protein
MRAPCARKGCQVARGQSERADTNICQRVGTLGALPTVGFFRIQEPTVNSKDELTVASGLLGLNSTSGALFPTVRPTSVIR